MNKYIAFMGMGFEIVGLVMASVYFGEILDEKFQTKGLILIAFIVISFIGWVTHMLQLAKRLEKRKD